MNKNPIFTQLEQQFGDLTKLKENMLTKSMTECRRCFGSCDPERENEDCFPENHDFAVALDILEKINEHTKENIDAIMDWMNEKVEIGV